MNFYHSTSNSFKKGMDAKSIAMLGILLSLVLLLHYITDFLVGPLATFLKFDFSLLPIIIALFLFNFGYASILLGLRFCFELILNNSGVAYWYGPLTQLQISFIFLLMITLFGMMYNKLFKKMGTVLIGSLITSVVFIVIYATLSNGSWSTPLYLNLLTHGQAPVGPFAFNDYYQNNVGIKSFLGGFPNGHLAAGAVFTPFNLIKFGSISIICIPLISLTINFFSKEKVISFVK